MSVINKLKQLGLRRGIILALGLGLVVMGLDAGVAHFAGRAMKHAGQLIPVIVGPLGFLAVLVLVKPGLRRSVFTWGTRVVAGISIVAGMIGSAFHTSAFLRILEGQELTGELVGVALAVAPPLAAPGAFIGLGMMLWAVASPRLAIELRPKAPALAAAAA